MCACAVMVNHGAAILNIVTKHVEPFYSMFKKTAVKSSIMAPQLNLKKYRPRVQGNSLSGVFIIRLSITLVPQAYSVFKGKGITRKPIKVWPYCASPQIGQNLYAWTQSITPEVTATREQQ